MSAPSRPRLGGPARRLLLALLPSDDWSQAFVEELDAEFERLRARGAVRHSGWWYARQLLAPRTILFLAIVRRRERQNRRAARPRCSPIHGPPTRFAFGSWLDVKLAFRMLAKYPGLTGVAVFALALGIPASLAPLHFLGLFESPLPFEEGERIVGVRHRTPVTFGLTAVSVHEYTIWRETLTNFEAIGAALSHPYNVVADDGSTMAYRGARITASAFDVLRVAPLLGRQILEADEAPGAPQVIVISHEVWQTLLGGDPAVLGRRLRLGGTAHTIVGVMPEGFHFPYIDRIWLPLQTEAFDEPGAQPEVWVFGRLTAGVSESAALAELRVVHRRLGMAFPDAYGALRPEIVPFAFLISGSPLEMRWAFGAAQLFALLLLAVACGNVGTLILARTAARSAEVAVRTALGATRARIVSQLFVESLLLALLSTGIGLGLGGFVAGRVGGIFKDGLPFWFDFSVTRTTVTQALALAVFSSVIAGVLPALRATGGSVHATLQRTASGSASVTFGRITGALIVTEVALGVVCLFLGAVLYRGALLNDPPALTGADRILTAELFLAQPPLETWTVPTGEVERRTWMTSVQQEVLRRVASEPGVEGVALTRFLPREGHSIGRVEIQGDSLPPNATGHRILRGWVGPGFFDALGHPVSRGRDFAPSELTEEREGESRAIIVNTTFVERVLNGGNAIGRRVRYAADSGREPGPWLEIVGVVGSLGMIDGDASADDAGLYHPLVWAEWNPVELVVHVRGDPVVFAPRLRQLAAEIDPGAMIRDPKPLNEIGWEERLQVRWSAFGLGVVAAISVVLSVAGLYALMAFTVAQRTREIGLRTALGADAADIMAVIAKRALAQLGFGVALGASTIAAVIRLASTDVSFSALQGWPALLATVSGAVVLLGVAASVIPTLRGLRIRPMDAMRV